MHTSEELLSVATVQFEKGDVAECFSGVLRSWIGILSSSAYERLATLCARLAIPYADDPRLLAIRACVQDALGMNEVAKLLLRRATAARSRPEHTWHVTMAQVILSDTREEVHDATIRAWRTYGEGVSLDPRSHIAALVHIGGACLRHRFELAQGIQALELAAAESSVHGEHALRDRSIRFLAFMYAWTGNITKAKTLVDSVEHVDDPALPWGRNLAGAVPATLGYVAYWSCDDSLAQAVEKQVASESNPDTSFYTTARMMAAMTAAASRDARRLRQASLYLQEIPDSETRGISWITFQGMIKAVFAEAAGDVDSAVQLARHHSDIDNLALAATVFAGILRRAGHGEEALQLLQNLDRYQRISYVRVSTLMTAAIVQAAKGRAAAAHDYLEAAIDQATAESIRRPFQDGDPSVRRLLRQHLSTPTKHTRTINGYLSGWQVGSTSTSLDVTMLALSSRERVVLAHLRTGRTLAEIAGLLSVSVNTIKSQQRSIYRKLDVKSRRELLER